MQEISHHLADLEPVKARTFMRKPWRYSLLSILIAITVAQIVVSCLMYARRLALGNIEVMRATLFAVVMAVFSIPLMGLVLAGLISLISVKSYSYKQRFWPVALVTILILQTLAFTSSLYIGYLIITSKPFYQ